MVYGRFEHADQRFEEAVKNAAAWSADEKDTTV
jgi:hypothetical protein